MGQAAPFDGVRATPACEGLGRTSWQPDAVNVLSDKLVFNPRLTPIAGRDLWHP